MRILIIVVAILGSLPSIAIAQEPSGTRAGAWAAEVSFSGPSTPTTGSILRFRSDRSAWLLGLTAAVGMLDTENPVGFEEDVTATRIGLRLGIRSLRSPGSATRPTLGFGILGQHAVPTDNLRDWSAGAYTEFGVTRFFGSSFSLGALADLQLLYAERRFGNTEVSEVRLTFDTVRLAATVYF